MGWESQKQSLADFDRVLADLNVRIGNDAPVSPQLELMRAFLADHSTMPETELLAKWNKNDSFKTFNDAAIVVRRLTDAVVALRDQPAGELRTRLRKVLSGSLTQDFSADQAKDIFYELEIATLFKRAGFTVALREPDVVVSGNGLNAELGMACKYPSSHKTIHVHLSKGYRQLTNHNMAGCVVIGLDAIVFKAAFDSIPKFLDFRQGDKHPLDVANLLVGDTMKALVVQRKEDYPAEKSLDGAILTLSMWGIWGEPAAFTSVMAWAVQCDAGNPILPDIGRLVEAGKTQAL